MASRSRSCRAAEAGGEIAAMVGGVDSVHHAATSVVPVKSGSPSRARVSINVVRLTPKFAADGRLGHATVQSSRAARTASSFSPEMAAGRPPPLHTLQSIDYSFPIGKKVSDKKTRYLGNLFSKPSTNWAVPGFSEEYWLYQFRCVVKSSLTFPPFPDKTCSKSLFKVRASRPFSNFLMISHNAYCR